MVSYAPEPDWGDLIPFLRGSTTYQENLSGPWRKESDRAFWFGRSSFAFRAVHDWMSYQRNISSPVIWFPDYFCNSALAPLRRVGANLHFYPVGIDLEPDWEACCKLAEVSQPNIFVLVHYFGQPAPADIAREFCRSHDALLLEDAAHALVPTPEIGVYGDFTVYSPYKMIPIPDGGLMVVNRKHATSDMAALISNLARREMVVAPWIAKKSLQLLFPVTTRSYQLKNLSHEFSVDGNEPIIVGERRMSNWARKCLTSRIQEIESIRSRRLSNQRELLQVVKSISPLTKEQSVKPLTVSGDCAPYRFALRFTMPEVAEKFFGKMIEFGCPVEGWPDLPPEIIADRANHREALRLRKTVVLIPVHQSVDMTVLVPMVSRALASIV